MEAMLGVGQVYIEQARFEAGVLVPALDNVDSELYKSLNQEELEEISKGHGRDANTKLKLALKSVHPPALSHPCCEACPARPVSHPCCARLRSSACVHRTAMCAIASAAANRACASTVAVASRTPGNKAGLCCLLFLCDCCQSVQGLLPRSAAAAACPAE